MPRRSLLALPLFATLPFAQAAHAGFTGDTIHGVYYYPDTSTVFQDDGTQTAPASFFFATGVPNTTVDVNDSTIVETFDAEGAYTTPAMFNGPVVTDETRSLIKGVMIDASTSLPGITSSDVSFTSDSVSINLQGLSVPSASDKIVLDVSFGTSVPEPASIALLGAGLIALGFQRRKRA